VVLNRTQRADYSHHTYIFLTKNPARYAEFNPWPENCWLLTTITNQKDADERIPELLKAQAPVLGVSMEPMLGSIKIPGVFLRYLNWGEGPKHWPDGHGVLSWLIIGAMTGPGSKAHQPKPEWVQSLIDQGRAARVPVFLKDNLKWKERIQEFPL
jgi:protein gp37